LCHSGLIWNHVKKEEYIENLNNETNHTKLNNLNTCISQSQVKEDIDKHLKSLCEIVDDVCTPLFKKKCSSKSYENDKNKNEQFFDNECKDLKTIFYKTLNIFRKQPRDEHRINMITARSQYKNTVRKKKFIVDKNKLINLKKQKSRMQNNVGNYSKERLQVIKQIGLQMTFFSISIQLMTRILYFSTR